jgi:hypothetical protein
MRVSARMMDLAVDTVGASRLLVLPTTSGVGGRYGLPLPGEGGKPVVVNREHGAIRFRRSFFFTFVVTLVGDILRSETHSFCVGAHGKVSRARRCEELLSLPWQADLEEPALRRRQAVDSAYEVAKREVMARVEVTAADLMEAAEASGREEAECLHGYYDVICGERLRPIRRTLHRLAVSQTYLGLTRRKATATRYAEESAELQSQVQGFLTASRATFESLSAERHRKAAELSGRHVLNAMVQLVAVAEIFRPACTGCQAMKCRECPALAAVRLKS